MRKLHLLLAEWRFEQKLHYQRTYKLMACFVGKDLPEPGEIFPMLADEDASDDLVTDDDFTIFSQAAATLGAT